MKKISIIFIIFILVVSTVITKNSSKKIDSQIFNLKEDLRILNDKYELVLLDYNFLSSPKKLLEYQKNFFENDLIPSDIENFKKIYFDKKKIIIDEIVEVERSNENN
tara:strand:+ start:1803 stop:2123 length:321 start_codon:yes stop_codon:yes gene_type:complete